MSKRQARAGECSIWELTTEQHRQERKPGQIGPRPNEFSLFIGGNVCTVRMEDKGNKSCIVTVYVHGVPARGIIDSGADITIQW